MVNKKDDYPQDSLENWRRAKYGGQGNLATELSVAQSGVSRYELGATKIPDETVAMLRELGYTGPLPELKLKAAQQLDIGKVLHTANEILTALEKKTGFKARTQAERIELLGLFAEEVRDAIVHQETEAVLVRLEKWILFAEARRK